MNETYDDYIDKQNLDFSFKENLTELTFYGSSDEFDKYYREFGKNKDFKVNRNIFNDIYDTKKNQMQIEENRKGTEEQKKLSELEEYMERKKAEINRYFGKLKFYDSIDSKYSHCDMNIDTVDNLISKRNELLDKLYSYYESKERELKNEWQSQINRAKYKAKCQACGQLKCVNGHQLDGDSISCGDCKGEIYWVDGPTHYRICNKCNSIRKLTRLVCSVCEGNVYCEPKFTDYIP